MTRDSEGLPRYRGAWLTLGWAMALLVALGSLWPGAPQISAGMSDKFLHFAAYAGLAFMFAGVTVRSGWARVLVGLLLFGGAIEVMQEQLTATRSGEWLDLAANAAGIAAGMFTAALFPRSWCREMEIAIGLDGRSR
ncbi:MAG TPA: VanZ family protein [Gammaproteobacteria bacterium]|nr:VanZ family protein [Gammaproteobacteria bacterium]